MANLIAFPFTSDVTYDSEGYPEFDRAVDASVLRTLMKNYVNNGIFSEEDFSLNLSGNILTVGKGVCFINGVTAYITQNTTLGIGTGESLVLRLNDETRLVELVVKSGTTPTRQGDMYELILAQMTSSGLVDTRTDTELCGIAVVKGESRSVMEGSTASKSGKSGLVPAPPATSTTKYLSNDGTWKYPTELENLIKTKQNQIKSLFDSTTGGNVSSATNYQWLIASICDGTSEVVETKFLPVGTTVTVNYIGDKELQSPISIVTKKDTVGISATISNYSGNRIIIIGIE